MGKFEAPNIGLQTAFPLCAASIFLDQSGALGGVAGAERNDPDGSPITGDGVEKLRQISLSLVKHAPNPLILRSAQGG
jgi:hypothetical protein